MALGDNLTIPGSNQSWPIPGRCGILSCGIPFDTPGYGEGGGGGCAPPLKEAVMDNLAPGALDDTVVTACGCSFMVVTPDTRPKMCLSHCQFFFFIYT